MSKRLFLCVMVLALAAFVSRPAAAETTFNFGLKSGASIANNLWNDDDGTEKSIYRLTFGAFAAINLTPSLAIQPEVNYLVTGEWWEETNGVVLKTVETYGYLHIPVLVKYRFMMEDSIVPSVFAGPAVGFLLNARWKDYEDGVLVDDFDAKDLFKSTDFGADFGAGIEFAIAPVKIIVDLRYYLGLVDVYEDTAFSMKNRSFLLTAGILF
jgi:hypothetical protein